MEPGTLDGRDWAVLYGYGLFETMRTVDGVPAGLDRHLDRMLASAAALGIAAPPREELARRVRAFCGRLAGRDRVVRVTLTAGNPDAGLVPSVLLTDRAVPYTPADHAEGIAVRIATALRDERSALVRHKTLNQMTNVLEWQTALRHGCREALFFNGRGHLAEGTRSNVFLVRDGRVTTPPVTAGILAGLTRAAAIELLRGSGVAVREADVTRDALGACEECFLTNAVMGILPVRRIGGAALSAPGAVTALAAARYQERVRDEAAGRHPLCGAGT